MQFSLPALPYDTDALEPFIDTQTMEIHYGKHHQTYVNNLNEALGAYEGDDLNYNSIEDLISHAGSLPDELKTKVRNNGGGHWNH